MDPLTLPGKARPTQDGEGAITPVIMAGGAGTRLWPLSRETMPKQFIALLDDGSSTFEATLRRVSGPQFADPIVITNEEFRFVAAEQMRVAGVRGRIVLEPERRDSAAAVALAALLTAKSDPETVCLALAADHLVTGTEAFVEDCMAAAAAARSGRIMTLGIAPTGPSTAYGYIEPGAPFEAFEDAHEVKRFVEKPDRARAERLVEAGLLWNSGNFLFRPQTMLEELTQNAPAVVVAARRAIEGAAPDIDFLRLDASAFRASPKISIDYAVMEVSTRVGVVRARFGWSDIGSWDSLHEATAPDAGGNVLQGDVCVLDVENSFVRSEGPLTTLVGLSDVVVVSMPDAVLVASRAHAGKVKDLVEKMAAEQRPAATQHLRIHRPWGWYQRIDIGGRFQVKHICVRPGGTLSLQRHHHRAEHWVVVHGTAEVTVDGVVTLVHENEAAYLPIGCTHRMRNPGRIELKIIEVQVGSYTGEDDIVRIEDIYARA